MSGLFSHPIPIATAIEHAPYLRRLHNRLGDDLAALGPDGLYKAAMKTPLSEEANVTTEALMKALRLAKSQAHLAIAASDLDQSDPLLVTTGKITDFADMAVNAALSGTLASSGLQTDGLFLAALGKMGAGELNYSSDIDMAAFFDSDLFDCGDRDKVETASRIVRDAMRVLDQQTGDGYVFRTDLRLRPDPSSTPLAVSMRRAELYYESVGQNWERMVWIKGRPAGGDLKTGAAFLKMIEPFVWRRHLDYWAIADVHAIKHMINAKDGDKSLADIAADVKLSAGGIREIEFFVQTQQIILGGRNPDLRVRGTLDGLERLVALGAVDATTADDLADAYRQLRAIEHRIQMLNDQQTHKLPSSEDVRADVAALCGQSSLDAFDQAVLDIRRCVNHHYSELFADEARRHRASVSGNLVFTGVDDDPGTCETLAEMGFENPSHVIAAVRRWHRARTPATRTARGREILTAMLPDLLSAMGRTGEADHAFARFSQFFEGLRSGVQTLSMLSAEPELLEDLVNTLALAPRIATTLARRPGLLEALLSVSDRKGAPEISDDTDFETAMEAVRRWHGEQAFLIGHSLLHGRMPAREAAVEWSALAETCIRLMAAAAEAETKRRFGPRPGEWCIAALGKLGGREMTAGSDLDLLVIYEGQGDPDDQVWFTKFTQRLITALSAETGEGSLYEVDMRLRPSGRAGPVATSISAFETYHMGKAWTWEHMALTRLRPVAGDEALGKRVVEIALRVIREGGDPTTRTQDILDMRQRLWREKPPTGPWDLKMRAGGLVDIEFLVQQALLTGARVDTHHPELAGTIQALAEAGAFDETTAAELREAFRFLQSLQQVQRLAVGADLSQANLSAGLKDRFCRAVRIDKFADLEARLEQVCEGVAALRLKKIGPLATESG